MLFNSPEFALFLVIAFTLYWFFFKKKLVIQNLFLLVASYFFYGWWDWRFLSLIFFSSLVDFIIGRQLYRTTNKSRRKLFLVISLITNLGILGFFKYYNFFIAGFIDLLSSIGFNANYFTLKVILPVGISFYTFQTLSYTIDIYYRKIEPTNDMVAFFAFVSFFPQLVAGPIERAKNLLPQFQSPRQFDFEKARDGMKQILIGLFKKIVIADHCAVYVDKIFSNYNLYHGNELLLAAVFFAFQIYCDFSGYSDIAIGTARLFGFDLMRNFAYPYFSRDIAEFWRRWHISLSSWFRDYVYIPLGGKYGNKANRIKNILITFTVSGLWHGANWTFITWGFLNGLYYIPLLLFNKQRNHLDIVASNRKIPSLKDFLLIIFTFVITTFTWIFFRSATIKDAINYISGIFNPWNLNLNPTYLPTMVFIVFLVFLEWLQRKKEHALQINNKCIAGRWILYTFLILVIIMSWRQEKAFIYFQF